jgi:PilZ domain
MPPPLNEQRCCRRQRVLKAGKIAFHDDRADLDCVVRDLSETGAGLIVDDASAIPECFNLTIQSNSITRSCRIVWRAENRIGVSFQ